MITPKELATGLETTFLPEYYYAELDLNEVLTLRDNSESFEADWNELLHLLEEKWNPLNEQPEDGIDSESIRFEAFSQISCFTAQHEIANYVSDDFELIYKAIRLELEHPMLSFLLSSYQNGEFPHPTDDSPYS